MSCCNISKKSDLVKELELLKKKFDVVELEVLDDYQLLTFKNKVNKPNIDWVVWLQVKVRRGHKRNYTNRTDADMLKGICKSILDWVDALLDFNTPIHGEQLSLFDEEKSIELEKLPPVPRGGEDNQWAANTKKREGVRKRNLMKQYSFFELCDLTHSWYIHKEISYFRFLPKSNQDMIELVKESIVKGTSTQEKHGRFDDYWWDNDCDYIKKGDSLSDLELINRVRSLARLYLVPYKRNFYIDTDLSYSHWEMSERTDYVFWFDGRKIHASDHTVNENMPYYDLFDFEFISWLREYFNISPKESISDEDVMKMTFVNYFSALLKSAKDFNLKETILQSKDWKQLRTVVNALIKKESDPRNGGSGGPCRDGFICGYSRFDKGRVDVIQRFTDRARLNRDIGDQAPDHESDTYTLCDVSGDDIYVKAFELFKIETKKQTTMFDFMAA
ncbi:MAG: hypothetical protein COB67_02320 [SAR324 cluster bacterium]|uniref:Uncharacterized protein n=1 Tax=SAR324 cluster bacterium TaxID=2024889 RepID=A0A2A4T932_9DELT|nr:MAG: hypothetical protein COB67_02320 [SAR324 cluster bacterium]